MAPAVNTRSTPSSNILGHRRSIAEHFEFF